MISNLITLLVSILIPASTPRHQPEIAIESYKDTTTSETLIMAAEGVYRKWGSNSPNHKVVIVDFTKPLEKERLFVIDIKSHQIIKSSRVCHGVGSGRTSIPEKFSNNEGSKMSSKGVFRTAETYYGSWGYSMRVDGLEPGVNSNARRRLIIFHNADKQSAFWSWGCFSMPGKDYKEVIDLIKGGNLVFAFSTKEELENYIHP